MESQSTFTVLKRLYYFLSGVWSDKTILERLERSQAVNMSADFLQQES